MEKTNEQIMLKKFVENRISIVYSDGFTNWNYVVLLILVCRMSSHYLSGKLSFHYIF